MAFEQPLSESKPVHIQSDKGTEFLNREVQQLFLASGVNFYTTEDPDTKAAFAERVIRTLKNKIYRYLTLKKTKRYMDVLPQLVLSYNKSKHRSIGMAPENVTEGAIEVEKPLNTIIRHRYTIGEHVRIALAKTAFKRGYTLNWSAEIFTIQKLLQTDKPTRYKTAMEKTCSDLSTNLNYKVCNIVFKAQFTEPVRINTLCVLLPDIKYAGKNSSVYLWRRYASFMIHKSGCMFIYKCKTEEHAASAVKALLAELSETCIDLVLKHQPVICNMVATYDLGYKLDLQKFSTYCDQAFYEPDLHVSLFANVNGLKATITHTGKAVIFGAKMEFQFQQAINTLIDIGWKSLYQKN